MGNRLIKLGIICIAALPLIVAFAWAFGPREPLDGPPRFDPAQIGTDLESYLYEREKTVPKLVRGAQKHILWADPVAKEKTRLSIVYVHGFSATLQEIRPVPDDVAQALGANLFFTRLSGHGQDGAAMARASVPAWRADMAEALEIGRRIGDKVIVIATSTGATLATLAAFDPDVNSDIAGIVQISPNYGLQASGAWALTLPYARDFVPMIAGKTRGFVPDNLEHRKWWTEEYPTEAVIPMATLVSAARDLPFEETEVPALFIFSDADEVVRPDRIRAVADRWGGRVSVWPVAVSTRDDRHSHVLAGDILSPGLTEAVTERILEWVKERSL